MKRSAVALLILATVACSEKTMNEATPPPSAKTTTVPAASPAVPAPQNPANAAGQRACDLVTPADLKRIIGIDFQQGVSWSDKAGISQCDWNAVNGAGGVEVIAYTTDVVPKFAAEPGMQPLAGIGDRAVRNPKNGSVIVARGGRSAAINIGMANAGPTWGEELARIAAQKL